MSRKDALDSLLAFIEEREEKWERCIPNMEDRYDVEYVYGYIDGMKSVKFKIKRMMHDEQLT